MATQAEVESVLSSGAIAVIGASRGGKKFGNSIIRELTAKGYTVYPVHPEADTLEGIACVRSFKDLSSDVDAAVFSVPPPVTEELIPEAVHAGIRRVWLQQGAQSEKAVAYCQEHDVTCVSGECILMFASPVQSVHRFHRWLWGVIGKLPK